MLQAFGLSGVLNEKGFFSLNASAKTRGKPSAHLRDSFLGSSGGRLAPFPTQNPVDLMHNFDG
jgi:hypothetical protein